MALSLAGWNRPHESTARRSWCRHSVRGPRSSVGATAWSSLRVTPRARIGPTVSAMDFAQLWARYGDRVLVTALAAMYAVELLRWDDARLALAIPLGLAGCFLLLLRRRLPVVMVVLVLTAIQFVEQVAPG